MGYLDLPSPFNAWFHWWLLIFAWVSDKALFGDGEAYDAVLSWWPMSATTQGFLSGHAIYYHSTLSNEGVVYQFCLWAVSNTEVNWFFNVAACSLGDWHSDLLVYMLVSQTVDRKAWIQLISVHQCYRPCKLCIHVVPVEWWSLEHVASTSNRAWLDHSTIKIITLWMGWGGSFLWMFNSLQTSFNSSDSNWQPWSECRIAQVLRIAGRLYSVIYLQLSLPRGGIGRASIHLVK